MGAFFVDDFYSGLLEPQSCDLPNSPFTAVKSYSNTQQSLTTLFDALISAIVSSVVCSLQR